MRFVLNRNRVVASTCGLSIEFVKGVPTLVPPAMYQEVIAIGATPEDEIPEDELPPKPDAPTDAAEREAALFAAFAKLEANAQRDDFTAGGSPQLSALSAVLGWGIQPKERDAVWTKYRANKSAS